MSWLHPRVSVIASVGAVALIFSAARAIEDDQNPAKNDAAGVGRQSAAESEPLIGIGVAIQPPQPKDGVQKIEDVAEIFLLIPNRPAALSRELEIGDHIVAVAQGDGDAIDVRGQKFSDLINLIRGPAGSEVRLTIIPRNDRFVKSKVVSLIREPLVAGKLSGRPLPDATVVLLSDGTKQTVSEFLGKVLVLEFWATWCAPCMEHVATMQTYTATYPNWSENVRLVTVSLDEEPEMAKKIIVERRWNQTHNVWGDQKVKRVFNADLLPVLLIANAKGEIVAAGNPRSVNIVKIVNELLKDQS